MGIGRIITFLLCSLGVWAQPVVLTCTFGSFATDDGVEPGPELRFELARDDESLEAHIRDGIGVMPVTLFHGEAGETTFFAVPMIGGLTITTVMPSGEAVHSRHAANGSELSASQHYGVCR